MKHYFCLVLAVMLVSSSSFAQDKIPAGFDERVELVSAVFHLSGAEEFNRIMVPEYEVTLDSALANSRTHPVVSLAAKFRAEFGIGYDAVASYALHLGFDADGALRFNDDFAPGGDISFDRWPDDAKSEFLVALNDFYQSSGFRHWYRSTAGIRAIAVNSFDAISSRIDLDWYERFFEKRMNARFRIVLSILAGPDNYGCHARMVDGTDLLNPVIGCCQSDNDGVVRYNSNVVLPVVIHEFAHSFCNPLNHKYYPLMESKAAEIYKKVRHQLRRQAYTSPLTMLDETFVRASVICYLDDHFPHTEINKLVCDEEVDGFILTRTFVNSLKKRQLHCDKFPTMNDYMPHIVIDVNKFSVTGYVKSAKEAARNKINFTCNIRNGGKDLDPGEFALVLTFDRPMVESIAMGNHSKGYHMPDYIGYSWSEDHTVQTIRFRLRPASTYGLRILGEYYRGQDGSAAGKSMNIMFKTK